MRITSRAFPLGALAIVLFAASAFGQVTTGTLSGRVVVQAEGEGLPGAGVEATHQPTGTKYSTNSREDGRFTIVNVRVGGPYLVIVSAQGFRSTQVEEVYVQLGADTFLDLPMQLETVTETIVVTGQADQLINPNRAGAGSAVSVDQIETLPTVRRSLQDFARLNPYFSVDAGDASATRVTVAGRNNRYNSIQLDGAVNNDVFGLADTGTPGGQADTQPVSLDAIQELQLVVSPYDVRQSGFTGGGINAVTRSGSNQWHGSVYGSTRDEGYVGELNGRKVSSFTEDQYGARLGGPIVHDQAFFFVSGETNNNDTPTGFSADGSATNQFGDPGLAQAVGDILRTQYGFDPGGLSEFVEATGSDLLLAKIDWNVSPSHILTFRHNWVDAAKDRIESGERNSTSRFSFPSYYYDFTSETNSTVVQVNSTLGGSIFNEARLGYQTIKDRRAVPVLFPDVEIRDSGFEVNGGVNRFSQANALDQDILELTDDVSWLVGDHTLTLGTHNEFFTFKNLFLDAFRGFYGFSSLDNFEAGIASSYAVGFSNTGKDTVDFDVAQYGVYAGDQLRVNDKLTLSYGLRVDIPTFPDTPSRNPLLLDALGIDTSDSPDRMILWQPRFGFNWSPGGTQQVRGGIGIFAGRTPYVWMSNNYQNSGVEFSNLSTSGVIVFDPTADPPRQGAAFLPRLDGIEPDFEFPQVLRTTLGYDRELPWGVQGTVEAVWSQAVKDVYYTNENLLQSGTLPDGRPNYRRLDGRIDSLYLLRNTSEGEELNLSLQVRKRFDYGLDLRVQYAYGDAESLADLTSSRAVSNFRFSPQVDSVHPEVATTFFEVEHRGLITATYNFATGPVRHSLGLYYSMMSGAPYTFLFSNDVNFDNVGQAGNDPIFVPASPDQVVLTGGLTWEQLDAFIRSEDCLSSQRGRIHERNSCNQPYTRQLDLHYGIELPIRKVSTELTLDLLNLLNFIDEDEGLYRTTPFNTYNLVRGSVAPDGRWSYAPAFTGSVTPGNQFSLHDTRSRWQAKLGLRVTF